MGWVRAKVNVCVWGGAGEGGGARVRARGAHCAPRQGRAAHAPPPAVDEEVVAEDVDAEACEQRVERGAARIAGRDEEHLDMALEEQQPRTTRHDPRVGAHVHRDARVVGEALGVVTGN